MEPNQSRIIIDAEGTGLSGTHVGIGLKLGMQNSGAVLDTGIEFQTSSVGKGIDFTGAGGYGTSALYLSGSSGQAMAWSNSAGTFDKNTFTAGSQLFKAPDNSQYYDNYDTGAGHVFRGGAGGLAVIQARIDALGAKIIPVAVAGLGTCNSSAEGTLKPVTDSTSATFNASFAGGGTNHIVAYCNGSAWVAH